MKNRRLGLNALFLWVGVVGAGLLSPSAILAQIRWQDLVLTGGLSAEGYRGNLPAATVSAVDCIEEAATSALTCTKKASAVVGEMGLRGGLIFLNQPGRTLDLQVDAGLRQFSTAGFKVRDYAPREWVGRADLTYRTALESRGELFVQGGFAGRNVEERPPMPLFIQPGYSTVDGRVRLQFLPVGAAFLDAQVLGEVANYSATALTPQLDLLDRKMIGLEAGMTWDRNWILRVHTRVDLTEYDNQDTFDSDDPDRRDRSLNLGATWTLRSNVFVQLGVEGAVNRSNSSRPEYDALTLRAVVSMPLSQNLSATFFANLTDKRYLTKTDFARLVPGEEADNASVVYLELARPLMVNLDGAVRFGWTRAEEDIGKSYYERYGATLLLRYRPWDQ